MVGGAEATETVLHMQPMAQPPKTPGDARGSAPRTPGRRKRFVLTPQPIYDDDSD